MAWDDRFQEEADDTGARCLECDAPISDDNERADYKVWRHGGYSDGYKWTPVIATLPANFGWSYRMVDGCRGCWKEAAKESALLFLQHDSHEDAMTELAEYLGIATGSAVAA